MHELIIGTLTRFRSFNFNVVLFKYLQVQILFEETFFNNENKSFAVLCIEQPLEGGIGMELFSVEYFVLNIMVNKLSFVFKISSILIDLFG